MASALAPPQKPHFTGTSRGWCYTLFDPTTNELDTLRTLPSNIQYHVWQLELCPTTQRLHVQGYFICASVRIAGAKRIIGFNRVHLGPRSHDHAVARDYCTKEDTRLSGSSPTELGKEPSGSGTRSDLESLGRDIRAGATERQLFENHTGGYLRYARSIERARGLYARGRTGGVTVFVLWGDTGTGKTRAAYEQFPDAYWLPPSNGTTIWWPGYDSESTVIVDDFGAGGWPLTYWLRVCDRYPLKVQTKGGFVTLAATEFVFTSNLSPMDWYPGAAEKHREALVRRLTTVVKFSVEEVNVQRGKWPISNDV